MFIKLHTVMGMEIHINTDALAAIELSSPAVLHLNGAHYNITPESASWLLTCVQSNSALMPSLNPDGFPEPTSADPDAGFELPNLDVRTALVLALREEFVNGANLFELIDLCQNNATGEEIENALRELQDEGIIKIIAPLETPGDNVTKVLNTTFFHAMHVPRQTPLSQETPSLDLSIADEAQALETSEADSNSIIDH